MYIDPFLSLWYNHVIKKEGKIVCDTECVWASTARRMLKLPKMQALIIWNAASACSREPMRKCFNASKKLLRTAI